MNDEGNAVLGNNVFKKSVEKYIPIYFLKRFTVIPGRGPNETVIRSLVAAVEEVVFELVLQPAQRFDGHHDIRYGDAFAEILEQPIAEGFKADRCKHDLRILLSRERQNFHEIRSVSIDVIDPANQIDLRELDLLLSGIFEKLAEGADGVLVYQFEGDLSPIELGQPCDLSDHVLATHRTVVSFVA